MFLQIDMVDSQVNDRPDGSVEILGQSGYIVVKAEYAKGVKAAYQDFLKTYPEEDTLKIAVNIEVSQPVGQIVNEG